MQFNLIRSEDPPGENLDALKIRGFEMEGSGRQMVVMMNTDTERTERELQK